MNDFKFLPEDFTLGIFAPEGADITEAMASMANARLAEMLEDAPIVYGYISRAEKQFHIDKKFKTHKAKLVCIKEIK